MSDGKAVSQNEELTSEQKKQMEQIENLETIKPKESVVETETDGKKTKSGKATKAELRELMENKKIVSGVISGVNRGGLSVKLLGNTAFCPLSQFDTKKLKPEDLNSHLNLSYDFIIDKIESKGTNIILTRIPLVVGDIAGRIAEIEEIAKAGGTVSGVVSGILMVGKNKKDEAGAFVNLGEGLEGLVHISELSWTRATKVNDVVQVGETYTFKVLSVDRKEPLTATNVKLSIKKVGEDPWKNIANTVKVGDFVNGVVTRIMNNGVFIRLEQGIEALIRTEDLSWEKKKISDVAKKGQEVSAKVININLEKHQIDCSLKDEKNDPWINITGKYKEGAIAKGIVADEKEYGYFVDLEPGITGLLNKSHIAGEKGKKDKLWKKGDEVEVTIRYVDTEERKIALSFGEIELAPVRISDMPKKKKEKTPKSSSPKSAKTLSYDTAKSGGEEMSEFANLLKSALKK